MKKTLTLIELSTGKKTVFETDNYKSTKTNEGLLCVPNVI